MYDSTEAMAVLQLCFCKTYYSIFQTASEDLRVGQGRKVAEPTLGNEMPGQKNQSPSQLEDPSRSVSDALTPQEEKSPGL